MKLFSVALIIFSLGIDLAHGIPHDGNIALEKPSVMYPSAWRGYTGPETAVDGNLNTALNGKSCTHPKSCGKAWWMVNLGDTYNVKKIVLHGITDTYVGRLKNFQLLVLEHWDSTKLDSVPESDVCYSQNSALTGGRHEFKCANAIYGQYVVLRAFDPKSCLIFCEIQVYGDIHSSAKTTEKNIALNKPVELEPADSKYPAKRIVDGNPKLDESSCSLTSRCGGPTGERWFMVDLGGFYSVNEIHIVNKAEFSNRLSNFRLLVSESFNRKSLKYYFPQEVCAESLGVLGGGLYKYRCKKSLTGRYVIVYLPKASSCLQLCEVLVYGSSHQSFLPKNIALNKPTIMRTKKWLSYSDSDKGVDGNGDPSYSAGKSCVMPIKKEPGWWMVNLGNFYSVTSFRIVGTADYNNRLKNFKVLVFKKWDPLMFPSYKSNEFCARYSGDLQPGKYDIKCESPVLGQYVVLYMPDPTSYMTFCEFEVYGELKATPRPNYQNVALHKPSFMSQTPLNADSHAVKAVDGNRDPSAASKTCAITKNCGGPAGERWWMVDLQQMHTVKEIHITNMADNPKRLYDFRLLVLDRFYEKSLNSFFPEQLCASFPGVLGGGTFTFKCNQTVVGRYVVLYAPKLSYCLELCEVEVFGQIKDNIPVNIALNKPAVMSTTKWQAYSGAAAAVDGNSDPESSGKSCVIPAKCGPAWWMVNLGSFYKVNRVHIINSMNYHVDKLKNVVILVYESFNSTLIPGFQGSNICKTIAGQVGPGYQSYDCDREIIGQYVVVYSPDPTFCLIFCEIEVFGDQEQTRKPTHPNVALHRPASMSYAPLTTDTHAVKAVDGNKGFTAASKSCAITKNCGGPAGERWWMVDLQKMYTVDEIHITNMADNPGRLRDFRLLVLDRFYKGSLKFYFPEQLCATYPGVLGGGTFRFKCKHSIVGKYVVLFSPKMSSCLELCEVEVFGSVKSDIPVNIALNKPTVMSTKRWQTYSDSEAAVDGNSNPASTAGKSCIIPAKCEPAWWMVNLGSLYSIKRVNIINSMDYYVDKLKNVKLLVYETFNSTLIPGFQGSNICKSISGVVGAGFQSYSCDKEITGQYLVVYSPDSTSCLTFCEIEVFGDFQTPRTSTWPNLALNKPTIMFLADSKYPSHRAVQKKTLHSEDSCAVSQRCGGPAGERWWMVDLLDFHTVHEINIYNKHQYADRLRDFRLLVVDRFYENSLKYYFGEHLCTYYPGVLGGGFYNFKCQKPLVGRYIVVYLPKASSCLQLCNVEVLGEKHKDALPENIALNKPAIMSHLPHRPYSGPETAVDGITNPFYTSGKSCTVPQKCDSAWWMVNLGDQYSVSSINIVANAEYFNSWKLKDFKILVLKSWNSTTLAGFHREEICFTHPDILTPGYHKLKCDSPVIGQYVVLYAPVLKSCMTFCEFEVFGSKVTRKENEYLGCYYTNIGNTETPLFKGHPKAVDALSDCLDLCAASNFKYAGLSFGATCYCQNELSNNRVKDPESNCNMPCKNGGQKCGGFGNLSVFKIDGRKPKHSIALHRPATMYPNPYSKDTHASRAVDGTTDIVDYKTCAISTYCSGPAGVRWLQIDLGRFYNVTEVIIYNRAEYADRLKDFRILVVEQFQETSLQYYFQKSLCVTNPGVLGGGKYEFKCIQNGGNFGRHVVIYAPRLNSCLQLCEVEVYGMQFSGKLPVNIALNKPTEMFPRQWKTTTTAANGVDGNLNPNGLQGHSCVISNPCGAGWWMVDLGKKHQVERVNIVGIADSYQNRLKNFRILVQEKWNKDNLMNYKESEVCASRSGGFSPGLHPIDCRKKIVGQFVVLYMPDPTSCLAFCEIEVFGTKYEDIWLETTDKLDTVILIDPNEEN